jgi:hypothetical protein
MILELTKKLMWKYEITLKHLPCFFFILMVEKSFYYFVKNRR